MSYRIRYSPESSRRYPKQSKKALPIPRRAAIIAAVCAAVVGFFLAKPEVCKNIFIPGDPQRTGAAFAGLVDDIRGGDPFPQAIKAFCTEIVADDTEPSSLS